MKQKLLFTSLLLVAMMAVTSCSFGPVDSQESYNVKDLLVYENNNPIAEKQSAGGFDVNPINTTDIKLKYNYDELGDVHYGGNLDYMPSTGNVNLLIIPVQFADYPVGADDAARQKIYNAYFGSESDIGGYESVRTYFEKSSFGQLQIGGVVSDWYKTDYTTYIGFNKEGGENEVADLVGKAFEWYKKAYNSDGTEFDSDHDGYVDALCLIYNAPARLHGKDDQLWAYCYWRQVHRGTTKLPNANAFFWASTSFMDNPDNRKIIDTHTYIHELGHVMGLDDYYNYANDRRGCTGGYIMEDMNVGDHDPFSKMAFNWITPTLVTGSTRIELSSFTDTGQVLIFKSNTDNFDSPFDEYLAVELYTPTGLNKYDSQHPYKPLGQWAIGPDIPGLRIWHVDGRLIKINSSKQYVLTNHYDLGDIRYSYSTAMTNTDSGPYASLVKEWRKFRLLQAIQQGNFNTYKNGKLISDGDLWQAHDSFDMDTYEKFFPLEGKFNDGTFINMSLVVEKIENNKATLRITF